MSLLHLDKLMNQYSERRVEQRYQLEEAVALKIIFASDNPELLGRSIVGATVDISASGLRLTLAEPLNVNSTVDVNITLRRNFTEYYLSGKVRWCEQIKESEYQVGLALHDVAGTETDFKAWKRELSMKP